MDENEEYYRGVALREAVRLWEGRGCNTEYLILAAEAFRRYLVGELTDDYFKP